MFIVIDSTLKDVKNESAYDQLSLYNGIFMLLYDQRLSMASVNVKQEQVDNLLDGVYKNAKALTVQKEQSKKLQKEIIDNYADYKEAIDRAYLNLKERS